MALDNAPILVSAPETAIFPQKKIRWENLAVGAFMNILQVTTLGQPLEVLKTHIAANRQDGLQRAVVKTWARGGFAAFYQGLIPWAWLEASTKGAILILASGEVEMKAKSAFGLSPGFAGVLGGVAGGASQSYLTMGVTTCMKTVEVTRSKSALAGTHVPSTMETFFSIIRAKGIRGVYRGVNAVAMRQISGWSSRIGISRYAENQIRSIRGKSADQKLGMGEKVAASTIGGALSCWNQPFEVVRVEMQSMNADPTRPEHSSTAQTLKHILRDSGVRGLFRGVIPRIGVASWATICMIGFGDKLKEIVNTRKTEC